MKFPFGQRRRQERELEEEIRAHLEMAIRDRIERGETEGEARESARREFGNVILVKEVTRSMWGWTWLERLGQDLHYGVRMLAKKPGFALIAIITLALGIGANTALFSVVNVVLLNPFPYPNHSQIHYVGQRMPKIGVQQWFGTSGPEFIDLTECKLFEQVAAVNETLSRNLTGGQEPERISAAMVSADFFSLLGVHPLLGRTITAADQGPQGERVLVINHGLWQRRFGGTPDVLGQKVFLDDEPYTIVGVMPVHFFFGDREVWFPFSIDLGQAPRQVQAYGMGVLTRLKPGVSLNQANAELELLARNQEQAFSGSQPAYIGRRIYLQPISEVHFGQIDQVMIVLLGAVGLILLIACANIATLLLARTTARTREIALRAALGAGRLRIIRQLLTESIALALFGGALGALLALFGVDAIVALIPPGTLPLETQVKINGQVLLFTFIVSLVSALMFGLWPALSLSKPDLNNALKEGARQTSAALRHRRARNLLVVFQVAISLLLLVMAGLMVRSIARLMSSDPGFNPKNVLTMRLNIPPTRSDGGQLAAIFQQLIDRVRTVPGVELTGVASHIPFHQTASETVTIEGDVAQRGAQSESVDTRTISTDYFQVLGIRLIQGERFTLQDRQGAPAVVMINQAMAQRFWLNENAVGKRLKLGSPPSDARWMTVKGVVSDSAQSALNASIVPEVYFPLAQRPFRKMNLVVLASVDPISLVGAIRREVQSLYKDQPVYDIWAMEELIDRSVSTSRFAMILLGVFAGLALVLAAVGVYGVISYSVVQRTREFGVRIAMGAGERDVLRLVVAQGMKPVLIGVATGLCASFALTRLMESLLYGVNATDPLTFVMGAFFLSFVALFACWVPARRATKVDPLVALHCE